MTAARRVGVMGGTFDPIHCGHLDLGRAAIDALGLERLLVLPSNVPPHRPQPAASGHHRFAMAAMAVSGEPAWQVSDLELQSAGPSYTTATLARFSVLGYAARELFFVIGTDAFSDVETWMNYPSLLEQAHFAVVSRPGHSADALASGLPGLADRMVPATRRVPLERTFIFLIRAATADVSSTAIRQRRAQGLSIRGLVDPRVEQHIEQHGLYAPIPGGPVPGPAAPEPPAGRLHG